MVKRSATDTIHIKMSRDNEPGQQPTATYYMEHHTQSILTSTCYTGLLHHYIIIGWYYEY